jgi:branched-chain amino acid transport system substrate-binding protein
MILAGLMAVAACSSDDQEITVASSAAPVPTTTEPPDGRLRIGFLLPETGPGAAIGQSLLAGAELAVDQINDGGGIFGQPISTIVRDEGGSVAMATSAIADLLDVDVDVVIGPASSRVAYNVLAAAVRAGVAVCSPTNTAIGLSDYPDRDLYVRTIPTDALQAIAIGEIVERSGETTVAVLTPDDDYGEQFADRLVENLLSRGLTVVGAYAYEPSSEDRDAVAARAVADSPDNLVLIGSGDSGAAMLNAVRGQDPEIPIFVSDAMKSPAVTAALGERAGTLLANVVGVAPHAEPVSGSFAAAFVAEHPELSDDFAAYAYDCVNLMATAALSAGTDDPSAIVTQLSAVSRSGDSCSTFGECADLIALGKNINLNGASGELEVSDEGEVESGVFRTFSFDQSTTPVDGDLITVSFA